jgi:hypothetical protein
MRYALVLVPFVIACSGHPQVLTGQAAPSFGNSVMAIQAKHGAKVLASAQLAADGSFHLVVPPSRNVTLQLVGSVRSDVVFPRHSGTIQRGFLIRGHGRPFVLGTIRLQPTTTVAFHDGATQTECSDGKDATGATCVDDSADTEDTCEADDSGETEASDDNGAEADASESETDAGDSTADHNFPSDGCAGGGGGGSGSGSGV